MKFIDKIKNYFYDEEEVAETKKTELPKVDVDFKAKSENKPEKKEPTRTNDTNLDVVSERELFKSDPTFNFPIIFDDEDFKEEKPQNHRISVVKKEQTKIEETIERKVFKPSPNISPIYGVISNEPKTEKPTTSNSDNLLNLYDDNKKVNIDDVLGKVYEQKRVEIKKENYTELKRESDLPSKNDLSLDLFNSIEENTKEEIKSKIEVTKESINSVDEKLKTIDELLDNTNEDDFYSLVDSMYKENDEEGDK